MSTTRKDQAGSPQAQRSSAIKRSKPPEGAEELGGFGRIATLDPKDVSGGAVLQYLGTMDYIAKSGASKGKGSQLHVFRGAQGLQVGLFGAADLNHRVARAAKGDKVWVCYDGLQQHPTDPDRTMHVWAVARVGANSDLTDEAELGVDVEHERELGNGSGDGSDDLPF